MKNSDRRGGKKYITLLLIIVMAAAFVAAAIPLQRRLTERLDLLKQDTVTYLEGLFDRNIRYDSISPSIFRCIEVRGLRIHDPGANGDPLLEIARVRVFYRIIELLRGGREEVIREVRVENSSLSFHAEEDKDLLDLLFPGDAVSTTFPDIIFSGRNLRVSLTSEQGTVTLGKLFFELKPSGETFLADARFALEASADPTVFGIDTAEADVRISGNLERDFSSSNLTVRLSDVYTPAAELRRITLQAGHNGKDLSLRKIQDKAPFDVLLGYNLEHRAATVTFSSEDFIPYTYLTPGEDIADLAPWFTTVVSGTLRAQYSLDDGDLFYDADLRLDMNNRLLPAPFSVDFDGDGSLTEVTCRRLRIRSEYGLWGFRGSVAFGEPFPVPEGTLWLSDVPMGGATIDSVMTISKKDPYIRIRSSETILGGITLRDTVLDLVPYTDDVDFTITTYLEGQEEQPLFSGDGNLQIRPDLFIQATAAVERLPVGPVVTLFSEDPLVSELTEKLIFSTTLFVSTDFERFSFTTSGVEFADTENPDNRASFALSGNNAGFSLDDIDVLWNEAALTGYAGLTIPEAGGLSADMSLVYRDTPYNLTGSWNREFGLLVHGGYGITATLRPSGEVLTFQFTCENVPLPLEEGVAYISLRTDGIFESPDIWNAYLRQCSVTGLPLPDTNNRLTLSGRADQESLMVYRLAFSDSFSSVGGTGVIDTSILSGKGDAWLDLSGPEGKEHYILQVSRDRNISAQVRLSGVPLARFTDQNLSGIADATLNIRGEPDNPFFDAQVSVSSGQFNGDPFSAVMTANYDGNILRCSDLEFRFMNNVLDDVALNYDLTTGEFSGSGSLKGAMNREVIGARVDLRGATTPAAGITQVPSVMKEPVRGNLTIDGITRGDETYDDWDLEFIAEEGGIYVEGGPERSLTADLRADKTFLVTLGDPLPIRGIAEGSIEQATLDAELKDVSLDAKILDTILQIPQFRFLEGKVEGNLKVSGSFNDPEIWGTAYAEDVMAENPYVADKIGPFEAVLEFEEKTLSIQNALLPAGNARTVADVSFTIDHWLTDAMVIDLQTISRDGLHVIQSFGKMNIDGYARGHLNIEGDANFVFLTGSLEVLSTVVTIQTPEEQSSPPEAKKFFSADVKLTTGKGVEFLWPTRNLPVLRTFAETGEEIRVTYDGAKEQYTIRGEVGIMGGQIYYVQRNFYIREGTIVFNENQNKFDPILSTTAEIREITAEGDSAKIYLIVEENALSTFQPRFESEPSMSTTEIFNLLGGQMFYASGAEGMDLTQALALTGDFVGQFGLLRTFEERVKTIFNLDLFTFRTPVVSNLLLEKILPQEAGYSEPESLGKYLDNTTLFLGKYFGNDLFLQAILRLDFSDQIAGGIDSEDMDLDTEITLEWKTPVTLIEFSLFPDVTGSAGEILNPSLGLTWRYSY